MSSVFLTDLHISGREGLEKMILDLTSARATAWGQTKLIPGSLAKLMMGHSVGKRGRSFARRLNFLIPLSSDQPPLHTTNS